MHVGTPLHVNYKLHITFGVCTLGGTSDPAVFIGLKENSAYETVIARQQQQKIVKKMEPCPAYELTRPH